MSQFIRTSRYFPRSSVRLCLVEQIDTIELESLAEVAAGPVEEGLGKLAEIVGKPVVPG